MGVTPDPDRPTPVYPDWTLVEVFRNYDNKWLYHCKTEIDGEKASAIVPGGRFGDVGPEYMTWGELGAYVGDAFSDLIAYE